MTKDSLLLFNKNTLGRLLKSERTAASQRQKEVAEAATISVPTLRLLERGQGTLSSFWRVLEALNLELVGRNLPKGHSIGAQVATLRKIRGIRNREIAALVNVSPPTITALETKNRGRLETLSAVLGALGAGEYLQKRGASKAFFTHAGNSSLNHKWTTPPALLEKLYAIVGIFDLDPCSPTKTRSLAPVKARIYFTVKDNGLELPWFGHVFVNPPYGKELKFWIAKAQREVEEKTAVCVTALIPARTDTKAWHDHVAGKAHVFLLKGRLAFGQGEDPAPFPSAIVVWGGDQEIISRFQTWFSEAWYIPPHF